MYSDKISELEVIKNVENDFFKSSKNGKDLNCNKMLGNIDFCVSYTIQSLYHNINFLWAEAKKGNDKDIIESLIQLILTIGKEKTYSDELPPAFLGAFDCEKIAFIEYHEIQHIFSQNDFNWNVAPSNHESKEFKQLYSELQSLLDSKKMLFYYEADSKILKEFIESNFVITNKNLKKIQIDKNNFIAIFRRWLEVVKPSISVEWELEKPEIVESDFYLADVLSKDNSTQEITKTLRILLQKDVYRINFNKSKSGRLNFGEVTFNDNQKKHTEFWNLYERPPKEKYWDYMIERRDLLVPLDIREEKGAFFTPQIWVYKAQEFLQKEFGENYQDEYYIWDCAAGTGNLLVNLVNENRIFASTIDPSDVNIMHKLAKNKSLNLLENHIFQFDFLNDCFFDKPCKEHIGKIDSKCEKCKELEKPCLKHQNFADSKCKKCKTSKVPQNLQNILRDSNKRKKLIIFINPPYAEASNRKTPMGTGKNRPEVALSNISEKYKDILGGAIRELFALFFTRIYKEISGCILASFSTLKYLNGQYYEKFREFFKAKFLRGFICPAYTFDNVNGHFAIGFLIWNLDSKDSIKKVTLDVFAPKGIVKLEEARELKNKNVEIFEYKKKKIKVHQKNQYISDFLATFKDKKGEKLAYLRMLGTDVSNSKSVFISNGLSQNDFNKHLYATFTKKNVIPYCVYFAVRYCVKHTWLNDKDQFLYPKDKWIKDSNFHNDCLAFALFHPKNRISLPYNLDSINHFIPFSEKEINAKRAFDSDFLYKFLQGKIKTDSIESSSPLKSRKAGIDIESNSLKGGWVGDRLDSLESKSKNIKKDSKKGKIIKVDSKLDSIFIPSSPLKFSQQAKAVFDAGREVFKYYHSQDFSNLTFHYDDGYDRSYNPNASLYDIKAHFQGFSLDSKGNPTKMNALQKCKDSHFADLITALNNALDELALNIESKTYEYEFLIE